MSDVDDRMAALRRRADALVLRRRERRLRAEDLLAPPPAAPPAGDGDAAPDCASEDRDGAPTVPLLVPASVLRRLGRRAPRT